MDRDGALGGSVDEQSRVPAGAPTRLPDVEGPLALVGSGEYLPVMQHVEAGLLAGRPPRFVQIPTAAGREGAERLGYWVNLGQAQAERIGVESVPLIVVDRTQADDPSVAARVAGAGLIYLSGGDPGFLADTLRDTALWRAIVDAWRSGSALAGCSAGAMAMGEWIPSWRRSGGKRTRGLGLLPHLAVLPHFDRLLGRVPDLLTRPLLHPPDGVRLVGIDEDTAIVGGPQTFTVYGRRSAWLLGDGPRRAHAAGSVINLSSTVP